MRTAIAFVTCLLFVVAFVRCENILGNPSFELGDSGWVEVPVQDNSFEINKKALSSLLGLGVISFQTSADAGPWHIERNGLVNALGIQVGFPDIKLGTLNGVNAPAGNSAAQVKFVAGIGSGATISQVLGETAQPRTTYTLKVAIGNLGLANVLSGFTIGVYVGNIPLAVSQVGDLIGLLDFNGLFKQKTLTFATGDLPPTNANLRIVLYAGGLANVLSGIFFDDVHLYKTLSYTVNELPSWEFTPTLHHTLSLWKSQDGNRSVGLFQGSSIAQTVTAPDTANRTVTVSFWQAADYSLANSNVVLAASVVGGDSSVAYASTNYTFAVPASITFANLQWAYRTFTFQTTGAATYTISFVDVSPSASASGRASAIDNVSLSFGPASATTLCPAGVSNPIRNPGFELFNNTGYADVDFPAEFRWAGAGFEDATGALSNGILGLLFPDLNGRIGSWYFERFGLTGPLISLTIPSVGIRNDSRRSFEGTNYAYSVFVAGVLAGSRFSHNFNVSARPSTTYVLVFSVSDAEIATVLSGYEAQITIGGRVMAGSSNGYLLSLLDLRPGWKTYVMRYTTPNRIPSGNIGINLYAEGIANVLSGVAWDNVRLGVSVGYSVVDGSESSNLPYWITNGGVQHVNTFWQSSLGSSRSVGLPPSASITQGILLDTAHRQYTLNFYHSGNPSRSANAITRVTVSGAGTVLATRDFVFSAANSLTNMRWQLQTLPFNNTKGNSKYVVSFQDISTGSAGVSVSAVDEVSICAGDLIPDPPPASSSSSSEPEPSSSSSVVVPSSSSSSSIESSSSYVPPTNTSSNSSEEVPSSSESSSSSSSIPYFSYESSSSVPVTSTGPSSSASNFTENNCTLTCGDNTVFDEENCECVCDIVTLNKVCSGKGQSANEDDCVCIVPNEEGGSDSTTTATGLGIGLGVGIPLLGGGAAAAAGAGWWLKRRYNNAQLAPKSYVPNEFYGETNSNPAYSGSSTACENPLYSAEL